MIEAGMTERSLGLTGRSLGLLLARSQSGTFSSHSLVADDAEMISEAEEINEVRWLLKKAEKLLLSGDLQDAVQCYTDALEIDEDNVQVLRSRASTFLSLKDYQNAYLDSEHLVCLNAAKPEAHYLRAVSLDHLGRSHEAIYAFLDTMSLDTENSHVLSNHVLDLAGKLCQFTEEQSEKLSDLDPCHTLCEIGSALHRNGHDQLVVKVLNVAQSMVNNQRGLTVKMSLTLGQAQANLGLYEQSILCYQDCYTLAHKLHDYQYQTKSLINLATILLQLHRTHLAVYYYTLLLDLETELLSLVGTLPNYWVPSLRCALRLNLSLGYKTIGNMEKAFYYANLYMDYMNEEQPSQISAQSLYNIGSICQILGKYDEAIDYFKRYLKCAKRNKRLTALANGCLGNVYTLLHNWSLAEAYFVQQCEMAQTIDEKTLKSSILQLADLYFTRFLNDSSCHGDDNNHGNYTNLQRRDDVAADLSLQNELLQKAAELYNNVVEISNLDSRSRAKALFGLSGCYAAERSYHHAIFHLDSALHLAESLRHETKSELKSRDLLRDVKSTVFPAKSELKVDGSNKCGVEREKTIEPDRKFYLSEEDADLQSEITHLLADCLSWSLSDTDLSKCLQYFKSLIAIYQEKIASCQKDGFQCPQKWPRKLNLAYDRLIVTLIRLRRVKEALCYAETSRDYDVTGCSYDDISIKRPDVIIPCGLREVYSFEQALGTVNECEMIVVYYSLIGQLLITWVLNAADGLVTIETSQFPGDNVGDRIRTALEVYNAETFSEKAVFLEDRSIPRRGRNLNQRQTENENLATKSPRNKHSTLQCDPLSELYKLLIQPIKDHLAEGSDVVIVPDASLWEVPFPLLQNEAGSLKSKVNVTLVPSLKLLSIAMKNSKERGEEMQGLTLKLEDVKQGGFKSILEKSRSLTKRPNSDCQTIKINPKMTSHPNLVHNSGHVKVAGDDVTIKLTNEGKIKTSRIACEDTLTTLTSRTWTGTDVMTSHQIVTSYRQVSSNQRAVCIGNPNLPKNLQLHGLPWKPTPLLSAEEEVCLVSDYLNISPITGEKATRQTFMDNISRSTLIHLACYMCPDHGYIAMAPDHDVTTSAEDAKKHPSPPDQTTWLITCQDIVETRCAAQLVVLSGGWSTKPRRSTRHPHVRTDTELLLARAFIEAGTECVLHAGWPIRKPDRHMFFSEFYSALYAGAKVTEAYSRAADKLSGTCPFLLIGRDVHINLCAIQSAMLDQTIDEQETKVSKVDEVDYLNPPKNKDEETVTEVRHRLQKIISALIRHHQQLPDLVPLLIDLIDMTLKRIHSTNSADKHETFTLDSKSLAPSNPSHESTLDESPGVELLVLLGYALQCRGHDLTSSYNIIFPRHDPHKLLVPVYDGLKALLDIVKNPACIRAFTNYLPQSQRHISYMIDLLCLSKHVTSTVQLRLSDLTVNQLRAHKQSRDLMTSLGFHPIGPLLGNCKNPDARRLQNAALQLLLCLSTNKDPGLMHKLNVDLLGHNSRVSTPDPPRPIPSLDPVRVPPSDIRLACPWLSRYESRGEMMEKMTLVKRLKSIDCVHEKEVKSIKTWHKDAIKLQAQEALNTVGIPPVKPKRVKVRPVSSLTQKRVPIDYQRRLTVQQIDDRRSSAHCLLHNALSLAGEKRPQKTKASFLPYIRKSVA